MLSLKNINQFFLAFFVPRDLNYIKSCCVDILHLQGPGGGVNGFGTSFSRGVVISVTECDRWGGGGQKNQEKCGRRLWTAPHEFTSYFISELYISLEYH